jgi:hypothetical protein
MLILFDHGTPKGLASALPGHTIVTAQSRGWDRLNNGTLPNAAEEAALDHKGWEEMNQLVAIDTHPPLLGQVIGDSAPACFDLQHKRY